ncbi:gamma carbonic anhydrase family protein [Actinoallomurus rhizosphaericola]|uniref:gamma carbonic anhydrase family protein n=1 Tax=Actinoallomurus rhizosphaericola TaxID=2952536 RepID=UPI00209360DA|nr:gamma carbonic anhydrase family protein [Actinoallomurus rhizosphaericola]MCO5995278.1 gamma carbonic anhydrase family protein [Actinoallomurus rhizosphaericola]
MAIYALGELTPDIHPDAFVHPDATVIGAVTIGPGASVWPAAVLRGDYGRIEVGAATSIQDGTVLHTTEEWPTLIGDRCVVGHNAHLEGCTVGDDCLIGSGSTVLNRAVIEPGAAVGAAALVTEDSRISAGHIAVGVPARERPAPGELTKWIAEAVALYQENAARYRTSLRRIG